MLQPARLARSHGQAATQSDGQLRLPRPRLPIGEGLDLSPGVPDLSAFPRNLWLRTERAVLTETPPDELGYGDPRGHPRLRAALAPWLARTRGLRAGPDDIIVVSGVAQAMALLAQQLHRGGLDSIAGGGSRIAWRRRRIGLLGTAARSRVGRRRRDPGGRVGGHRRARRVPHTGASVPDGCGAGATATPRAARLGDGCGTCHRGRLRRRVPLRPRSCSRPARRRAGPHRLRRQHIEKPRPGVAAGLAGRTAQPLRRLGRGQARQRSGSQRCLNSCWPDCWKAGSTTGMSVWSARDTELAATPCWMRSSRHCPVHR